MNIGFVYLLGNPAMKVVKIGCTERSPHLRAAELSNASGVPAPFYVAAYVEVHNFQVQERQFHQWLAKWRSNPAREFFHDGCVDYALRIMYFLPKRLSFSLVEGFGNLHAFENDAVLSKEPDPFVEGDGSLDAQAGVPLSVRISAFEGFTD